MTSQQKHILSLQTKKPLTYLLQNTHLQDHLSYVDQDVSQLKSKVAYMVKFQQQQSMATVNPYDYIKQLQVPLTPFINSQKFIKELQRVKLRIQNSDQSKKDKLLKSKFPEIDQQKLNKGKLNLQALRQSRKQINSSLINYEQNILKNIKLETSKVFSPILLKQMIQSLQIQKSQLERRIERQREQISEINRLRKYEQLQGREKEQIVQQRIKLMINKRRKLE